jgi:SSS family solute:Na+ symporter
MWVCTWFSVPTWALFMFIGTALFAFYQDPQFAKPDALAMLKVDGPKAEGILPFFVIREMPIGVTGLVIAAVLSAAMSSISSSINGVCAVSIVDVYRRRMVKDRDDNHYVRVAKLVGVAQGIIMIVGALILTYVETKTLQDTSTQLASMMAGGLAALYLLGFLTVRCNGRAAFTGIFCTLFFTGWMATIKLGWVNWPPFLVAMDTYYVGLVGNVIMFFVGYLAGLTLFPRKEPVPTNYSVWTQDDTPLV